MKKLLALSLLLLSACTQADHFEARQISFAELDGWAEDNHQHATQTFLPSCKVFARKPRKESEGSGLKIEQATWQSLCSDAEQAASSPEASRRFFEERFVAFRISNNNKEQGLFTGYYEPLLYGSFKKKGDFKYPLYGVPAELKNNKPYYTHEEINRGALKGRKLELLWVDDPVMKFFMQIQGSGRVRLEDGRELYIGYGDGNGQPYVSLGKVMRDQNLLPPDQINFFTIREWLYNNPKRAMALMEENPSYIFFKIRSEPAVGAAGVSLTPRRSIAIDPKYIPYGLPLYLEAPLPALQGQEPTWLNQLMIAQDTGGAIRGPVRGDIFFGPGSEAEYLAGYMKNRGVYTLLVPKEAAGQLAPTFSLGSLPDLSW